MSYIDNPTTGGGGGGNVGGGGTGIPFSVAYWTSPTDITADPGGDFKWNPTTNALSIAATGSGTIYGSLLTTEGLTLVPNSADTTGKIGLFDPTEAFFERNAFGNPSLIIGPSDPAADFGSASSIGIYDSDITAGALLLVRNDTGVPRVVEVSFADFVEAPTFTTIRARGSSFAGRTQPTTGDGMFAFAALSFKDDGSFMDDSVGAFGFEADVVFPGWVSGRLGFSIMHETGVRLHPLYFFPDTFIQMGKELADVNVRPADRTLQVQSVETDRITATFLGVTGQTANLSEWRDETDVHVASVGPAGNVLVAEGVSQSDFNTAFNPGFISGDPQIAAARDTGDDSTAALVASGGGSGIFALASFGGTFAAPAETPANSTLGVFYFPYLDNLLSWQPGPNIQGKILGTATAGVTQLLLSAATTNVLFPMRLGSAAQATLPLEVVGHVLLDNTGTASELRFLEPGGPSYTSFKAVAQAGTIDYSLPPAIIVDGFLRTDAAGVLSWSTAPVLQAYSTIQEEGVGLTQRSILNFVGAGITAADDTTRTTVTLDAGLNALAALGAGIAVSDGADGWFARSIAVTDTATVNLTITNADGVAGNPTLQADVLAGGIDHGGLAGLADDDHTQYLLLAGRTTTTNDPTITTSAATGTIYGSSSATGSLTLRGSSANFTQSITPDSPQSWWPSIPDFTQTIDQIQNVITFDSTFVMDPNVTKTHDFRLMDFSPVITAGDTAVAAANVAGIFMNPTVNEMGAGANFGAFGVSGVYTATAAFSSASIISALLACSSRFTSATANINPPSSQIFRNAAIMEFTSTGTVSAARMTGLRDIPTIRNTSTGAFTTPEYNAIDCDYVTSNAASGTMTTTIRRGLKYNAATIGANTPTIPSDIAVDVGNLNVTGVGATEVAALRSAIASGAKFFFLKDTGGAQSFFKGIITTYSNVALVGLGVPSQVATIDLTAQGAAIATGTALYAVPAAGQGCYRISWVATVTRAATTSSILGGNLVGFQVTFTDADTNVAKTTPLAAAPLAANNNAYSQTNALNTTGAVASGVIFVNARASTNIQYGFGYTSVGATTMQYNLHVRVEAM